METYTIEQIRDALMRASDKEGWNFDEPEQIAPLIDELTRPKFSEGQVVFDNVIDEYVECCAGNPAKYYEACRPLTQPEVGSDWVPREAAMKLRDAVKEYTRPEGADRDLYINMVNALADFDEAVK